MTDSESDSSVMALRDESEDEVNSALSNLAKPIEAALSNEHL